MKPHMYIGQTFRSLLFSHLGFGQFPGQAERFEVLGPGLRALTGLQLTFQIVLRNVVHGV